MKLKSLLVGFMIFSMVLLSGCTQEDDSADETNGNDVVTGTVELDSEKVNTYFTKINEDSDGYWMRSGWFYWNAVEPTQGEFDWDAADEFITEHFQRAECLLVVIFPYANWDQDACHGDEYVAEFDKEKGGSIKVGKPCDMEAYKTYLKALVERYDGDGIDDMPGLEIPVKYWEIMNEPSMQGGVTGGMGEELKFFVGTTSEYVDILKASYEAIKEADPDAMVLPAGIAGMNQDFQDFWDPIYAADIGNYFDIANIHTISTDENREDLYMDKYISFLTKYDLQDKPIWITELQLGELVEVPDDIEAFNRLMVRSSVFALALGADKLFHIVNWGKETDSNTNPNLVYETLISFMNDFDSIEILEQEYIENENDYDGLTSVIGHYKVTSGNVSFYVLWGGDVIPDEIFGTIRVTDIYGTSKIIDATELLLSDDPVYVELV